MNKYGSKSLENLRTCHPDLQKLFEIVVEYFDNTILEGHRGEKAQNAAFAEGKSKLRWPYGNHNAYPSNAVDVIPYPIDWNDRERIIYFAGFVMGVAKILKKNGVIQHDIRWGGDWNENTQLKDNSFDDLVHFEIKK